MTIECPWVFVLIACTAMVSTTLAVNTSATDWPRFIIAETENGRNGYKILELDANTGTSTAVSSSAVITRSLTANAFSNKVCHFHLPTFGFICHQNGVSSVPDVPRSNWAKIETFGQKLMSLSPFGDHLIFEEISIGGIWIYSLETQRACLLIPRREKRLQFLQVDWDNGYILALPESPHKGIEVWQLNGDSGVIFSHVLGSGMHINDYTIDPKTMTAYWASDTLLVKTSYNAAEDRYDAHDENLNWDHLAANSFRFYNGAIFWIENELGLEHPIYRFDVNSLQIDNKTIRLSNDQKKMYSIVVFEDIAGAKDRLNPCSKCSHICIPRQGHGYECTCPFEQPLLNSTVDGVRTECERPLTVWVIAEETERTSEPKTYLQSYDAMAKLENAMMSSDLLNTTSSKGHCTSVGSKSECVKFAGGSAWAKGPGTARMLAVNDDEVTTWFNGTCVLHQSKSKVVWTLYCNSDIDPDQVVLDRSNHFIFYRNRTSGDVVAVDYARNVTEIIAGTDLFTLDQTQPMRLAVDEGNRFLYLLISKLLCRRQYRQNNSDSADNLIVFYLDDRGFKDQQLRFIDGLLYWVQIRPNPPNSDEHVIVRFNFSSETQETFVKISSGFRIKSFAVSTSKTSKITIDCSPHCSHFCRKTGTLYRCLCPLELPVLQFGSCTAGSGAFTLTHDTRNKSDWPRFMIAETKNGTYSFTTKEINLNKCTTRIISSGIHTGHSFTANAFSDKVCHLNFPTYGIICHVKGNSFLPDIPLRNWKPEKMSYGMMSPSLSPFGDHLIFEEFFLGGVWIYNLETQRGRLLIPHQEKRFLLFQVDWDNGFILVLPERPYEGIEVWQLNGHLDVTFSITLGSMEGQSRAITGFTMDTKALTAYWVSGSFIAKSSYNTTQENPDSITVYDHPNFEESSFNSLRFYNDWIFWHDGVFGLKQHIYRLDVNSLVVDNKIITMASNQSTLKAIVVFEDIAGAKDRSNPCSKCSHICIPRRGFGYECTCPFGQPLLNSTVDGVRTECKRPLTVWVIAQKTAETSEPKTYLQTYDAMAKLENAMMSSKILNTTTSEGYCTSTGSRSDCPKFTGGSAGAWAEGPGAARTLAVNDDEVKTWFNGTCVLHQAKSKDIWTLYCNSGIDPDQVALDSLNWYIFYRNKKGHLVYVDLTVKHEFEDELVASTIFSKEKLPPMQFAVDVVNQVVYFFAINKLRRLLYGLGNSKAEAEIIFDLEPRGFKGQQLRFIDGLLYWVQIRPNPPNPDEHVIVRFNISSETQETFVKASKGFSIKSFAVASSGTTSKIGCSRKCSHFCSKRGNSEQCFCPEELPVLLINGECVDGLQADATQPPIESAPSSSSSSSESVFVPIISTIIVVAILTAIGFGLYKRYQRSQDNIACDLFLHGDENLAEAAPSEAHRAEFLPFNHLLDPNLLKVNNEKRLGEGNFGIVCEGEYDGRQVAVKTLKAKAGSNTLQEFFKELKIMAYIGTHPNIVELIGAEVSSIYNGRVFAVIEFCPNGSLDVYLKKHRNDRMEVCSISSFNLHELKYRFQAYEVTIDGTERESADSVQDQHYTADPTEVNNETSFTTANPNASQTEPQPQSTHPETEVTVPLMCYWSSQISSAMSYLTSKSIVHGDLATRNVLVFDNNILKVTDFGQSHKLYSSIYVERGQHRQVPWKWMSPEALDYREFSSKSDVWSYGVTLWEVFMFAAHPYPNQTWHINFSNELRAGTLRLPKPDHMPQEVYEGVFLRCFEADPEARIDFVSIENFWIQLFSPSE